MSGSSGKMVVEEMQQQLGHVIVNEQQLRKDGGGQVRQQLGHVIVDEWQPREGGGRVDAAGGLCQWAVVAYVVHTAMKLREFGVDVPLSASCSSQTTRFRDFISITFAL